MPLDKCLSLPLAEPDVLAPSLGGVLALCFSLTSPPLYLCSREGGREYTTGKREGCKSVLQFPTNF